MTEPTTAQPEPPQAAAIEDLALQPTDILLHLIVTLLAPMFLDAAKGDIHLARTAALETIMAYHARKLGDLLFVGQMVACGLAALGSLSLSMTSEISPSMALRLRGNANALNRSAERHRRAISQSHPADAALDQSAALAASATPEPADAAHRSVVSVGTAAACQRDAASHAGMTGAPSGAMPTAVPVADPAASTSSKQQCQALWGAAMHDVAAEYTAGLGLLPPAQRRAASLRAAALNSTASRLIAGGPTSALTANRLDVAMRSQAA